MKYLALLFSLLLASPAWGDVTLDATNSVSATATNTVTVPLTVAGSNRLLLCSAHITTGGNVSTYTYNGVALTFKASRDNGPSHPNQRVELWYLIAPATGANNAVLTLASAANRLVGGCAIFTDAHQTAPLGTHSINTNDGDVNTAPPSITVPSGGLAYDVVSFGNAIGACTSATPSGSQTERFDTCVGSTTDNVTGASSTRSTTGTMSWTNLPSAFAAQVAVPINKMAAAATRRPVGPIIF